ncbi:MAG: CHAD domain-containing protein [Planctomycetota bacterium]
MRRRTEATEVETKFCVEDAARRRNLLGCLGIGPGRSGRTEPVHDVYLDTEERALLAAGYGLRLRRRGDGRCEATLKGFGAPDADGVVEREEHTEPLPTGATDLRLLPDGPLRATITAAVAGRALVPLARVTGRRTRHVVAAAAGLRVEVCDDRVTIAAGTARKARREVEVELVEGSRAAFNGWVRTVARAARVTPSRDGSKLEAALRLARIAVPSAAQVAAGRLVLEPACGPDEPASRAAAQALARLASTLAAALAAARRGAVEGVHDVRTTARRLRAVLAAFKDEVPDDDRRDLRARLSALRRAAGPTRDLDVVREALEAAPADADAEGLAVLRQVLAARRRRERSILSRALAAPALAGLPDLVATTAARVLRREAPPLAVAGLGRLPAAVEPALARRAAIAGPLAAAEGPALHGLRVAAKRTRYAAETFGPAFGKPLARFAAATRALQDALGAVQDARAVADGVRSLARARGGSKARRAAATRAAVTVVEAVERAAGTARASLDARARDVFAPAATRALLAHLGKRAGAAAAAR